ncbi:MAG: DUF2066 domain-containing protein [Rudaea sp.]
MRSSYHIHLAVAFIVVACLAPVLAAAEGLYTGTAPVNSQSADERAAALRTALGQVVVKLSGDPGVLLRPEVVKAIAGADRYMQQYSYQVNNQGSAGSAQPGARLLLVVQFDRSGVDAMLHDLNLGGAGNSAALAGADSAATAVALPGSYRLWISGLRSAEDYARLIGALAGNDQVRALRVEQAHGNTVQVKVDTRGSLQSLLAALEATRLAHTTNARPPVAGVDALLDFEP